VLIIDDDKMLCDTLSDMVKQMGHGVICAFSLANGLKEAYSKAVDVVFLDVRLPDGNGLDVLQEIKQMPSLPEVIIITGEGDLDGAELAIKTGAWDYIEKLSSIKQIALSLVRALQYRKEKTAKPVAALKLDGIIGKSPQIKACFDLVAQGANSDAGVLITGETGTGKELFAQAVHANSSRADKSFVVVDCATLPETLVENVLFGHEKGAFTGADRAQEGLISQADGGTLFLDEIGELPMPVQKAFLRVLQERYFRPVGGKKEIKSNFRTIVATNRDLHEMVKAGRFRNDLLFRLESIAMNLPTLRERPEDIRELTLYFIDKLCERYETETKGFSPEFLEMLVAYNWPGNVRELVNILESALAAARYSSTLFPKHLPVHMRVQAAQISLCNGVTCLRATRRRGSKNSQREVSGLSGSLPTLRKFRETGIAELERRYLKELTLLTQGNIKKACRISGLSRSRLYALLKKCEISGFGRIPSDIPC
ncbi:MAG: sigma-54-dependent Fis family transcriptional regulator, partial [Deltaproteobacteria bacterium]|nr:sigma-54-dependent Fis family transcriptional regulator [Deltaproteobacteria bacterium]